MTPRTMTKPIRVMPPCVRFMRLPSSWNLPAEPAEVDAARAAVPMHPDQERLAAQVGLGQEVHAFRPEAAVLAIIAIVAHDEIVARRHGPFAFALDEIGLVVTFQHLVRAPRQLFQQQPRAGGLAALALAH